MENSNRTGAIRNYLKDIVNLSGDVDLAQAQINIRNNIPFRGPTVYILAIAVVIASVGLNVNSIPVIIGAMLISPLMGPIFGFGLGFGTNDMPLIVKSLKHLGIMMLISITASTLYFLLTPLKLPNPTELMARTSPTIYDVLIAFFGGLAGMLETARKDKGTVLSGVAIATALMPPLCTVGYGIATLNWMYALGALYLFTINGIFITLAGWGVVKYLHFPSVKFESEAKRRTRTFTIGLIMTILIVPSVFTAVSVIRKANLESNLKLFLAEHKTMGKSYIYDTKTIESGKLWNKEMEVELYLAGEALSPESRLTLEEQARDLGLKVKIYDNATVDILSESEVINVIQKQHEASLAEKNDQIKALEAELSAYKDKVLPSQQLSKEIRTQFPAVSEVSLAWAQTVSGNDSETLKDEVVVIVSCKSKFSKADAEKLQAWLKVRLNVANVRIIQEDK